LVLGMLSIKDEVREFDFREKVPSPADFPRGDVCANWNEKRSETIWT